MSSICTGVSVHECNVMSSMYTSVMYTSAIHMSAKYTLKVA